VIERNFFVYILANKPRGTLYVGELYATAESAIAQEKRLKKWRRQWKIELVEKTNLHWTDLYDTLQPS
jgi:putative endonuclease